MFIMKHQITFFPSQLSLTVDASETVLESARRQGFHVPRACDAGVCHLCQARLLSGQARHKHSNLTLDASAGAHEPVFCCLLYPLSDLHLEIERVLAPGQLPSQEVTAKIHAIEQAAPDVKIVQLLLPAGKKIEYYGGQYLQILLDSENVAAFSIANAPRNDRTVELHIREAPDSDSYTLLAKRLQVGELLRVSLPHGETTRFRWQGAEKLLFIAASTGYSQFKAILEEMAALGDERPVTLYWGARTARDLYRHDAIKSFAFLHPHLKYIPVVSDQPEWPARKGLVHQQVIKDLNGDFSGWTLVCGGSPAMVYTTFDDFVAAGMQPEQMISDVFDYAPRDPG
ncbi:MAG: CDP-6-deoxy-delta-3,4-glucoseen reductase [Ketobacter sp.]|nr:MAG: CDP-6-deoxy-delta-3,4-glucoseen reductase [Ketobacter sp.]